MMGGRSEIQFNIGLELFEGNEIFRYGLGFSLEPNQSQPDPINYLTPKIYAFNEYVQKYKFLPNGLSMWHWMQDGNVVRSEYYPLSIIPDDWVVWGNFIFIGGYFGKGLSEITHEDLKKIIDLFDILMPIYNYVESNFSKFKLPFSGNRISRICWNDKGWVQPSGRYGKSTDQNIHEGRYGYGHEEWLGDISKIAHDGYHYAFLESIRESQEVLSGNIYNIDLFTINGINHKRYLIGSITNTEVINVKLASNIKNYYHDQGWLKEMENQIVSTDANSDGFSNWERVNLFNIRFKPEDLKFFSDYILINDEKIKKIDRYTFVYKKAEIKLSLPLINLLFFILILKLMLSVITTKWRRRIMKEMQNQFK